MKSRIQKNLIPIVLVLGVLILIPCSPVTGTVVWEETFEGVEDLDDLIDWEFFGVAGWYYYNHTIPFDPKFTLVNGTLAGPSLLTSDNLNTSQALHNSTVAYGTWSFDVYFSDPYALTVEFVFNSVEDYYRYDNAANVMDYLSDKTGYALGFQSNTILFICYNSVNGHNIAIEKSIDLTGYHHIDITRNSDGLFIVFFDKLPIIQYTNTLTTTSKKFGFTSLEGCFQIDNITVDDSAVITTTTTEDESTLTFTSDTEPTTSITTESGTFGFDFGIILILLCISSLYSHKKYR